MLLQNIQWRLKKKMSGICILLTITTLYFVISSPHKWNLFMEYKDYPFLEIEQIEKI